MSMLFTSLFVTLKVLNKNVADDNLNFLKYFSEKIRLGISCESSAKLTIHMKFQALIFRSLIFSGKQKSKCYLLQLFLALDGLKLSSEPVW